jgi:hypothetical protein
MRATILPTDGTKYVGVELVRDDGSIAELHTHTEKDKEAAASGAFGADLQEIQRVKEMVLIDAMDGKLDNKLNGRDLVPASYTIHWSQNSASALLLNLAQGRRTLRIDGRDVEVPKAWKDWVIGQSALESAPGARIG